MERTEQRAIDADYFQTAGANAVTLIPISPQTKIVPNQSSAADDDHRQCDHEKNAGVHRPTPFVTGNGPPFVVPQPPTAFSFSTHPQAHPFEW